MRILLTGASSFTGFWFVRDLIAAGHEVAATFRGVPDSYEGVRARRVAALEADVRRCWQIPFASDAFLDLLNDGPWDVVCHHAAEMSNYRSPTFDALAATQANTHRCRQVLESMAAAGCGRLVVTGSVFEPFEGVGDPARRAFSPYGLSKHFSFEVFRFEAERVGVALGKFVIPNPFGPLEELRFTSYLAESGARGACRKSGHRITSATTSTSRCWHAPIRGSASALRTRHGLIGPVRAVTSKARVHSRGGSRTRLAAISIVLFRCYARRSRNFWSPPSVSIPTRHGSPCRSGPKRQPGKTYVSTTAKCSSEAPGHVRLEDGHVYRAAAAVLDCDHDVPSSRPAGRLSRERSRD